MKIRFNKAYSFHALGRRDNQEDSRFPDTDTADGGALGPLLVCDGVGGEDMGEKASALVADTLGRAMKKFNPGAKFADGFLADALARTYEALERAAEDDNRDMATTMTLILPCRNGVMAAHIGDSRIYQIRPGAGIIFRSEDHSLVNALVRTGNITPEEAATHPRRNVITRCMTPSPKHGRDKASVSLLTDVRPGDTFILCSDGVLSCVDDETLTRVVTSGNDDAEKRDTLRDMSAGSSDNNTLWLVSVAEVEREPDDPESTESEVAPAAGCAETDTCPITPPATPSHDVRPEAKRSSLGNLFHKLFG